MKTYGIDKDGKEKWKKSAKEGLSVGASLLATAALRAMSGLKGNRRQAGSRTGRGCYEKAFSAKACCASRRSTLICPACIRTNWSATGK